MLNLIRAGSSRAPVTQNHGVEGPHCFAINLLFILTYSPLPGNITLQPLSGLCRYCTVDDAVADHVTTPYGPTHTV